MRITMGEFDRNEEFQKQTEEAVREARSFPTVKDSLTVLAPNITPKRRGRPPGTKKIPVNLPPPSPEPKKQGKRPACEDISTKYPMKELIFYEEGRKHKGIGIFHDPAKGNMVAIMSFLKLDNGNLKWAYRVVPNRYGGKPIIHHDMTLVSPSNLIPLANALIKVAESWFGTQRQMDEARIEYQKEKKEDSLGDKIRRQGIF